MLVRTFYLCTSKTYPERWRGEKENIMETKIKILQTMLNDAKKHIEHCKTLLLEENLSVEDSDFLCVEIGLNFEIIEKMNWVLKELKGD